MARIALLFEYPSLNGGERSILSSIERLRGWSEFVAFVPPGERLARSLGALGVEVLPSPLLDETGERIDRASALILLADAVRAARIDVLHGNSLAMGRMTGAVAARVSLVCTAHLRDIVKLSGAAIRDLNGNARLVAVSEAVRAFHVGQGVERERATVVHNGVDLDRFRPRPRSERVRRELGIPDDALVALTVGQIGLRKGWDVLAASMAALAERFPTLRVVLVGERYSEKAETVAYEAAVRERFAAAMPGRAQFVGYRDEISDLMNAADLLVHPARQEPFGRVLLEAAASGLPIVATNVGGTAEMLEDAVSARLVPPGDAERLGDAIRELLAAGDLKAKYGDAARRRVEREFSADDAAQRLSEVWRSALSSP